MAEGTSIRWLHVTDLHAGLSPALVLWPNISRAFEEDLARLHERTGPWDIICFTGDITQQGLREEFEKANEIIGGLIDCLRGLGSDPVFLAVPGNHDLRRPGEYAGPAQISHRWHEDPGLRNDFWANTEGGLHDGIRAAFANYTDWWDSRMLEEGLRVQGGFLPGDFSATVAIGDLQVGIVGLNSSFLQLAAGDYRGRLDLHATQVISVLGARPDEWVREHDLTLLLTHHPPDWLSEESQVHFYSEISPPGRFFVHLFGHMHTGATSVAILNGSSPRTEVLGRSLFGLERTSAGLERLHGYSVGKVSLSAKGRGFTVYPRAAHRVTGGGWRLIPDPNYEVDDSTGATRVVTCSPSPRNAGRRGSSSPAHVNLSQSLCANLARLNKEIAFLTREQKRVLSFLHGHRQVVVEGCAGSGKTLVAVEKATRLAEAGLRTLLVCHNPYLAEHLRALVAGTPVVVRDFEQWVRELLAEAVPDSAADRWTQFHEPTDEELGKAFDALAGTGLFDAVVVDEGQDFRAEWWMVVEAALTDRTLGYLYVFKDDNQHLLPLRGGPPIVACPFRLSRNCRNAGRVFKLVSRLHRAAPPPEERLAALGNVEVVRLESGGDARDALRTLLGHVLETWDPAALVVLTGEEGSAAASMLSGLEYSRLRAVDWQRGVMKALARLQKRLGVGAGGAPRSPQLSPEAIPTPKDIVVVNGWVRALMGAPRFARDESVRQLRWLVRTTRVPEIRAGCTTTELAQFLGTRRWAEALPDADETFVLVPNLRESRGSEIALRSVASFKGLEVPAVLLYIPPRAASSENWHTGVQTHLYVGASRAVSSLYVLADPNSVGRHLLYSKDFVLR